MRCSPMSWRLGKRLANTLTGPIWLPYSVFSIQIAKQPVTELEVVFQMFKNSLPGLSLAAALLAAAIPATPVAAQSGTTDALSDDPASVFGYSVDKAEEPDAADAVAKVLQALEHTDSNAQQIRMTFGVENFRFVPLAATEMDKIAPEMADREAELTALRTAIEASAIFYSAMQSESVEIGSIVAVELSDAESGLPSDKRATVYFSE